MQTSRLRRFICMLVLTPALALSAPAGVMAAHGSAHAPVRAAKAPGQLNYHAQLDHAQLDHAHLDHAPHNAGHVPSHHDGANHEPAAHHHSQHGQPAPPASPQVPDSANSCCDMQNCHPPALLAASPVFRAAPLSARTPSCGLGAGIPPGEHAGRLERPPRTPVMG